MLILVSNLERIVLVGTVPTIKMLGDQIVGTISMLGGRAMIPENASYAVAVGAAMKGK